ncbi:hypothetical protein AOLI_G00128480 [Acnodon oligacanthus]
MLGCACACARRCAPAVHEATSAVTCSALERVFVWNATEPHCSQSEAPLRCLRQWARSGRRARARIVLQPWERGEKVAVLRGPESERLGEPPTDQTDPVSRFS